MEYITIEDYLKRGCEKPSFFITSKKENNDPHFVNQLVNSFSLRNDIDNTGKSCLLIKSEDINLII